MILDTLKLKELFFNLKFAIWTGNRLGIYKFNSIVLELLLPVVEQGIKLSRFFKTVYQIEKTLILGNIDSFHHLPAKFTSLL